MRINPYLHFNGTCREAFSFYERIFEGNIQYLLSYGESPLAAEVPEACRDWILHGVLEISGTVLMGSDNFGEAYRTPQGFCITVNFGSIEKIEAVYRALSEGGTVHAPLAETFWAHRYASLTDRYGVPWNLNYGKS